MKQSRREIKSIEAELRSIRADTKSKKSTAGSVSLLEAGDLPNQPSSQESLYQSPHQVGQKHSPIITSASTIAPTIVRQPIEQSQTPDLAELGPDAGRANSDISAQQKRQVECFPIGIQASQSHHGTHSLISQAQLASVLEQLRQSSSKSKKTGRRSGTSRQQAIRQWVEEKTQQINDLSTQQESAILELLSLSAQLTQADEIDSELQNELNLECEVAEIPHIERDKNGILVLTNRSIDQVQLQAKAANERVTAKTGKSSRLRYHSSPNRVRLIGQIWRWIWKPVVWIGNASMNAAGLIDRKEHTPRRRGYRSSGRRAATLSPEMPVTLKEAALLVVGSTLLRIGLDQVVISYPMLWIPSVLVMIAPAAFAIYRSTVQPPTGFAWGYRLFAILIGLLLGGRL
jgi:hypothetical protein